jgi:hypothetical protein
MVYKSPLKSYNQSLSSVEFSDPVTKDVVGTVYKKYGRWFLTTKYFNDWVPIEVFGKYKGFLLLLKLHKSTLG